MNIQPFLINIFQLHSNAARLYDYGATKFHFSTQAQYPSVGFVTRPSGNSGETLTRAPTGAYRPRVKTKNGGETLTRAPSGPE